MKNDVHATPAADQAIDARLTVVQEAVSALANPIPILEDIEAELDILADEEADPAALNAIHTNAITLLDSQQRLATAFMTTLELARALKDQREQARQTLADLKLAIENVDQDVPEIEDLVTSIEEMITESQMEYFCETAWESITDDIAYNSPLDYDEASKLINLLVGSSLEPDHSLWDELRDWMRRAQVTIETGICPEPDAN